MKPSLLYALAAPLLLSILTIAGNAQAELFYSVASVISGTSFTLADGRTVRLSGIQTPAVKETDNALRSEPLGEASRQTLSTLITGQQLRLAAGKDVHDRHARIVAQAYRKDGLWIQGEMLKAGMAMVYVSPDSGLPEAVGRSTERREKSPEAVGRSTERREINSIKEMLALEKKARAARRGIWSNAYYAPLPATRAAERINRYALIEGVPLAVEEKKSGTFINFGRDYKTDFTLFIARADMRRFKAIPPAQWVGRKLRVRGWVYERGGPMIDLTHPAQVEFF